MSGQRSRREKRRDFTASDNATASLPVSVISMFKTSFVKDVTERDKRVI